ncbi:MAG: M23 family metallopeptidase [Acidobacteriia bacterium]|nr:M23 family metallopeptidase [Terriglobia bacterium]
MPAARRFALITLFAAAALPAATFSGVATGSQASEQACAVPRASTAFDPSVAQIFLRFHAHSLRKGDRVQVDWIAPDGSLHLSTPYPALPQGGGLCFLTQMPVAGFGAASLQGDWRVRVSINARPALERPFQMEGQITPSGPRLTTLSQTQNAERARLTISGAGFTGESVVNIARYTPGGWQYFLHLLPETMEDGRIVVSYPLLPAAEYLVVVLNPDSSASLPHRLIIHTGGYKLPTTAGEPWVITQGPHGGFSHWGNSTQAYDIAPRTGRRVVAMRPGIAYTHDQGLRQTLHSRSFGNYITIDHGDGHYSHYAHLATGTFLVANGQTVQQGQSLATAGTSGYSFGTHLHVHVTRALPISSQSIPIHFEDLPAPVRSSQSVVSSNTPPSGGFAQTTLAVGGFPASSLKPGNHELVQRSFHSKVAVEEWWSDLFTVPKGARELAVNLDWSAEGRALELYLVSPTGVQHGPFEGNKSLSRRFQTAKPEAGQWRASVQGTNGPPGYIEFNTTVAITPSGR